MSFTTISPNMSLTIPVTGQETGPNWANDINNSLLVIDGHTHAAGSGVPITPDGLNINADLPLQLHNITGARSLRFNNYPSLGPFAPTAADVGALFEIAGELNYADGIGNIVPITKNGFVNGGAGTIGGLAGFPNASANYIGASGTFVWEQGVNIKANMDSATLILRYPGSYPTPTGNYIALQAPSSLATGYAFTLPAAPPLASNSLLTSNTVGDLSYTSFDQVGQGMTAAGANAVVSSVTAISAASANVIANARTRTIGTSVGIGGVAVSNSSGSFSTASKTAVAVTALSITITTSGRPVFLILKGGGFNINSTGAGIPVMTGYFYRDGNPLVQSLIGCEFNISSTKTMYAPASTFSFIDEVPAGGPYTYLFAVACGATASTVGASGIQLVAYEL